VSLDVALHCCAISPSGRQAMTGLWGRQYRPVVFCRLTGSYETHRLPLCSSPVKVLTVATTCQTEAVPGRTIQTRQVEGEWVQLRVSHHIADSYHTTNGNARTVVALCILVLGGR
jgi:hypothetical protein